ncbi:MAG: UDP-glucose--hexose-1-phosphate uridylyltransferase, partial [Bacilli bacterium]|nr:UDP-glucose--hexose-1-phosphate uridylyltransferase [Bacilli bacterium]
DILNKWKAYKNEELNILPITRNINHNTLNPIIRKNGGKYTLYLILRNNRTNEKYPDGIFYIKKENQNIKKENIGLIEAMGLAILPGRLKNEIEAVKEYILDNQMINMKEIHVDWAKELRRKYNNMNIEEYIKKEIALKFWSCLKDCCVLNASDSKEFKEILKISTK